MMAATEAPVLFSQAVPPPCRTDNHHPPPVNLSKIG